ncbi:DUF3541 domain-containing protein [Parasalinivibrio latis]|uniref:DUF3541 domain-containing protein n=1 Tax=Parasalinivibrio latis TaxID=2952610 RepID=UPI0030E5A6AC
MKRTITKLASACTLALTIFTAHAAPFDAIQDAAHIKSTFDTQTLELSYYQLGHYGLRMYRQTQDPKYKAAIWTDMARVADRLNTYNEEISKPGDVKRLGKRRLKSYSSNDSERDRLRHEAAKGREEYLVLGAGLISSMARADEYGLQHRNTEHLKEIINWYDFSLYATSPQMIRAWAAQLANQVYWLKQLGMADHTQSFINAFRETYPDSEDTLLSDQQFNNKLYGMTHIILAASEYYRKPVNEKDFAWIYNYFRKNMDTILARSKEDVVAEVGITFLLAGMEDDPVVAQARKDIQDALDREMWLVPSVNGSTDIAGGEHRNVLAVMLLDWQGTNAVPEAGKDQGVLSSIPWGLVVKPTP